MKKAYVGVILLAVALNANAQKTDALAGKQLFTSRCASCHTVFKDAVGPALKDVDKRRSESWIINFVHSSQKVVKSGDTAAVRLFESRNKTIMPDHPDLTDDNIKDIVAFIKEESRKEAPVSSTVVADYKPYPGQTSGLHHVIFLDVPGHYKPLTADNYVVWFSIGIFIVVLVTALLVAVRSESIIHKHRGQDQG